jgi:hypothetical protein
MPMKTFQLPRSSIIVIQFPITIWLPISPIQLPIRPQVLLATLLPSNLSATLRGITIPPVVSFSFLLSINLHLTWLSINLHWLFFFI